MSKLRYEITDICFKNGSVTKSMADKLTAYVEKTCKEVIGQKRPTEGQHELYTIELLAQNELIDKQYQKLQALLAEGNSHE